MNTFLATLLAGSSAGFSPSYSVDFETGYTEHADVDWDLVDSWQNNSAGLRFGYIMSPKMDIIASYQHSVGSNSSPDYYYDDVEYMSSGFSGYDISVSENIFSVGPKFNWNVKSLFVPYSSAWIKHRFVPYATAQLVVIANTLSMADTFVGDEYANTSLQSTAMAVGGTGALGLEIRTRPISSKFQFHGFLEYGGTATSSMNFQLKDAASDGGSINIGDLAYQGVHFRGGVGVRF